MSKALVLGILGWPVAHSRSPSIHARFARQTGHDIEYGRLLAPLDGFSGSLDFAADFHGDLNLSRLLSLWYFGREPKSMQQRAQAG